MALRDYPALLLSAWSVHLALFQLGFSGDEIFIVFGGNAAAPTTGLWLWVVLKAQGKEFSIEIGPLDGTDPATLEKPWAELCRASNAKEFSNAERRAVLHSGPVAHDDFHGFIAALLAKGFVFTDPSAN